MQNTSGLKEALFRHISFILKIVSNHLIQDNFLMVNKAIMYSPEKVDAARKTGQVNVKNIGAGDQVFEFPFIN